MNFAILTQKNIPVFTIYIIFIIIMFTSNFIIVKEEGEEKSDRCASNVCKSRKLCTSGYFIFLYIQCV